jgi:hypothetical protein
MSTQAAQARRAPAALCSGAAPSSPRSSPLSAALTAAFAAALLWSQPVAAQTAPPLVLAPAPQPIAPQQAAAQPAPAQPAAQAPVIVPVPAPLPNESPEEVAARIHYERALRFELDNKLDEAELEAEATLKTQPTGRFAAAANDLLLRVKKRSQVSERVSHRVELVTSATLVGIYSGVLAAGASSANAQGTSGLLMLGAGVGLGASLLASSGKVVPAAYGPMLVLGSGFGTWATLAVNVLADTSPSGSTLAGSILAAELGGSLAGLGAAYAFDMTGGDAGAASFGATYGGLVPGLFHLALSDSKAPVTTALIGSTIGLIGGPLLNRTLGWSRARYNVASFGGGLGALFAGGFLVLFKADSRGAIAGGFATGLLVGCAFGFFASDGFEPDEKRATRGTALLERTPDGGVGLGGLLGAVSPVFSQRRGVVETGLQLRAFEARF